jgi:predicted nucleic acid-binding protein
MSAVICDTGPLNYLVLIEAVEILPRLFSPVLIPPAVQGELLHRNAQASVREWAASPPSWISLVSAISPPVVQTANLHPGEREVIAFALSQPKTLILMDDRLGTVAARKRGLNVVGTLAILDRAASLGWMDLQELFSRLRNTSFRAPLRLMARMLEQDALRKR